MYLTDQDAMQYDRDGYLLVPNLFNEQEIAALVHSVEGGSRVANYEIKRDDAGGKKARLAIWSDIGDDIWGAVSICPRIVNNIRILMREEIAFYHGKVMLKEAHSGGAWEWHQDYGYWYDMGFAFPRMISAFVAIDAATRENGCLQVLKGSHHLGRISHSLVGEQAGADTARIRDLEKLFERVHVEMTPGSVLFFHCNLLHTSAPNESDHHRRSFIMCYNALQNPQIGSYEPKQEWKVCPTGSDDAVLQTFEEEALLAATA